MHVPVLFPSVSRLLRRAPAGVALLAGVLLLSACAGDRAGSKTAAGKPPSPYSLPQAQQHLTAAQTAAERQDWPTSRQAAEAALRAWPGLLPAWQATEKACRALGDQPCSDSAARFTAHLEAMQGQSPRSLAVGMLHLADSDRDRETEKASKDQSAKGRERQPGDAAGIPDRDRAIARQLAAFYDSQDKLKPIREAPVELPLGEREPYLLPGIGAIGGGVMAGIVITGQ